MIEPGSTASITYTTDNRSTAIALGSGDLPVLATPKVVALVEAAAVAAIAGLVPDGDTTVGAHIEVDHLAPTPIGGTVVTTATVVAVNGRRVDYEATVTEGATLVARATHVRYIVNRETFMDSARK
jgi:predicted thioesterase